ncbi:MAG: hypothetical protein ACTH31_11125 [Pseudoclavibacter sp.]
MENDSDSTSSDGEKAREALSALDADGARLAQRVITPRWYYPIFGVLVATMTFGVAYPGTYGFGLVAIGVVGLAVLVRTHTLRTGVWISQAPGPATRKLQRVLMVIYIVLMGAALALRVTEPSPWWALLPALSGLLITVVVGRHYDRVLRRELAASATDS